MPAAAGPAEGVSRFTGVPTEDELLDALAALPGEGVVVAGHRAALAAARILGSREQVVERPRLAADEWRVVLR